jgi:putative ABC transport system permease protein
VLRKTPLAWLQLTKQKSRFLVALAGIGFADLLMFVQLGFQDALFDASVIPHRALDADLVLINPKFQTLFSVKSFSRERLYQTLAYEAVESVQSLYIGTGQWRNPTTRLERAVLVWGVDPAKPAFTFLADSPNLDRIKQLNQILFDQAGRAEFGPIADTFKTAGTVETELNQQTIQVGGLFTLGASFAADGNVITSDSTFLQLFPTRNPNQIEVGLIQLKAGTHSATLQAQLAAALPDDVLVLTIEEFAAIEKKYWETGTAIGFIFSIGVAMGFIVGIVIVYQILYSDVSDHLPEYATLKAMGYTDGYLLGVLAQEALILGLLGYIPGVILSIGLYGLTQSATMLPIAMTARRAITVFVLTLIMCFVSGAIAVRKLRSADPADVF